MEEQQIHPIPRLVDAQSALPSNEGESFSQFEQEVFQPLDQGRSCARTGHPCNDAGEDSPDSVWRIGQPKKKDRICCKFWRLNPRPNRWVRSLASRSINCSP
jgi:hypothetical protein